MKPSFRMQFMQLECNVFLITRPHSTRNLFELYVPLHSLLISFSFPLTSEVSVNYTFLSAYGFIIPIGWETMSKNVFFFSHLKQHETMAYDAWIFLYKYCCSRILLHMLYAYLHRLCKPKCCVSVNESVLAHILRHIITRLHQWNLQAIWFG